MLRHSQHFWLAAFVVAWTADFLFWGKPAGISYLIFILLALVAGNLLAWDEKARVSKASLVLSGLVVILAAVTTLRRESFTWVLNGFLVLEQLAFLEMPGVGIGQPLLLVPGT